VAVDAVRPAVQQDHHRAVGGAEIGVSHIQDARTYVLQRPERIANHLLRCWNLESLKSLRLSCASCAELGYRDGDCCCAQRAAPVDFHVLEHRSVSSDK